MGSVRHESAFQGEQTTWTPLYKQDDEDQHKDFAKHRACIGFEKFIHHTQSHGGEESTQQISHATEYHHHKGIDNKALAHVGADVGDLTQRNASHSRNTGAKTKRKGVHPR